LEDIFGGEEWGSKKCKHMGVCTKPETLQLGTGSQSPPLPWKRAPPRSIRSRCNEGKMVEVKHPAAPVLLDVPPDVPPVYLVESPRWVPNLW